jgi:hypothetical protein
MSIPTLMIFKGGEMASRQVGACAEGEAAAVDLRCGLIGSILGMTKRPGLSRPFLFWREAH